MPTASPRDAMNVKQASTALNEWQGAHLVRQKITDVHDGDDDDEKSSHYTTARNKLHTVDVEKEREKEKKRKETIWAKENKTKKETSVQTNCGCGKKET